MTVNRRFFFDFGVLSHFLAVFFRFCSLVPLARCLTMARHTRGTAGEQGRGGRATVSEPGGARAHCAPMSLSFFLVAAIFAVTAIHTVLNMTVSSAFEVSERKEKRPHQIR